MNIFQMANDPRMGKVMESLFKLPDLVNEVKNMNEKLTLIEAQNNEILRLTQHSMNPL